MCLVQPYKSTCCGRTYVLTSRLITCPPDWPKTKCDRKDCEIISDLCDAPVGLCWRCESERGMLAGDDREALRPLIDKASLYKSPTVDREVVTKGKRKTTTRETGPEGGVKKRSRDSANDDSPRPRRGRPPKKQNSKPKDDSKMPYIISTAEYDQSSYDTDKIYTFAPTPPGNPIQHNINSWNNPNEEYYDASFTLAQAPYTHPTNTLPSYTTSQSFTPYYGTSAPIHSTVNPQLIDPSLTTGYQNPYSTFGMHGTDMSISGEFGDVGASDIVHAGNMNVDGFFEEYQYAHCLPSSFMSGNEFADYNQTALYVTDPKMQEYHQTEYPYDTIAPELLYRAPTPPAPAPSHTMSSPAEIQPQGAEPPQATEPITLSAEPESLPQPSQPINPSAEHAILPQHSQLNLDTTPTLPPLPFSASPSPVATATAGIPAP